MTFQSSAEAPSVRRSARPGTGQVVAILLGIAAIAVAVAWLAPPLETGNAGVAAGPPGSDQSQDPSSNAERITYVPAGRVAFGVEVRNSTFLPVVIDGLHGPARIPFDDLRLVLGTNPGYLGLEDDHVREFQPITLAPGETQLIGVIGQFPPCANARPNWSTGASMTFFTLSLDVRVAGVLPVESDVPLLRPVEFMGDADKACPAP